MSQRELPLRWGCQESQGHHSRGNVALRTGRATTMSALMQEGSTLDMHTGAGWQKVVAPSEDDFQSFFFSGKTGETPDAKGSMYMVDSMPELENTAADFNIVFKKNVTILERTFEENQHWLPKGKRGEGVSGCVTAHEDKRTNKSFVRKKIKKGTMLRREELKAMLAVDHPGICSLYGLMVHDGDVDILMQDAGMPLRDFLRVITQKGVTPDQYWTIVTDLTIQGFKACCQMHKSSVFHLDIKPENFLAGLNSQNQPVLVLADFGSALIGRQQMDLRLQLTPEYMAPEVWNIYRRKGRNTCEPQDEVQASFDVFAFGLTVYFMCSQRHLLLEVLKKKDSIIHPDKVQAFTNGKLDPEFGFKFLLMTEYAHLIPHLACMGPWLFPNKPPPDTLIEVMKRTLDPNPDTRWTDENVISFLTGEAVEPEEDTVAAQEEYDFKTPTQATDSDSCQYGDVSLEDGMDQVLNLRHEASPVPVRTPVVQCEDADVRSYGAQLLSQCYEQPPAPATQFVNDGAFTRPAQVSQGVEPEMERDVQVRRPRAQPLLLNSDVSMMDVEEPDQACAMPAGKPDFDMDMHMKVTYCQADVPDPRPAPEDGMEDLKKDFMATGLSEPNEGQFLQPPFTFCREATVGRVAAPVETGLQVLGVKPKMKAQTPGPFSVQAPPDITSLGKGGSVRVPVKSGGKRGKQMMVDPHKGVTPLSMKAANTGHGKHAAFLTQGKKMRIVEDASATYPVSFFVASSAQPGLATRVMPSPSFRAGSTAAVAGFTSGFGQSMQAMSATGGTASLAPVSGGMTLGQPCTLTPKQPSRLVSPWMVAEPAGNPTGCFQSIQQTSPGAAPMDDGIKLHQQGRNIPNFDLL